MGRYSLIRLHLRVQQSISAVRSDNRHPHRTVFLVELSAVLYVRLCDGMVLMTGNRAGRLGTQLQSPRQEEWEYFFFEGEGARLSL